MNGQMGRSEQGNGSRTVVRQEGQVIRFGVRGVFSTILRSCLST
ncbi:uncharacterized protein METZ01_LOCUS364146 [marine metagenome]|uniref:Uncharacterized protein n=1 Tax=marine metagenome TaxID=408172 RepID=A0A382SP12_9ZZZZ